MIHRRGEDREILGSPGDYTANLRAGHPRTGGSDAGGQVGHTRARVCQQVSDGSELCVDLLGEAAALAAANRRTWLALGLDGATCLPGPAKKIRRRSSLRLETTVSSVPCLFLDLAISIFQ